MALKKHHDDPDTGVHTYDGSKKARKGFTVGPANLPDGTYRRKSMFCQLHSLNTANTS